MNVKYDSIIDLPHHVSAKHPIRGKESYAAQFSPFAALSGYDWMIGETVRYTERRAELDEDEKTIIFRRLSIVLSLTGEQRDILITYFIPDKAKPGGAYVTVKGAVKKYDEYKRIIILSGGTKIPIDDVFAVEADIPGAFPPEDI